MISIFIFLIFFIQKNFYHQLVLFEPNLFIYFHKYYRVLIISKITKRYLIQITGLCRLHIQVVVSSPLAIILDKSNLAHSSNEIFTLFLSTKIFTSSSSERINHSVLLFLDNTYKETRQQIK